MKRLNADECINGGKYMSVFYIKNEQINGEKAIVKGEDVKHIRDVLRYHVGDDLSICDENRNKVLY